MLVRTVQTRVSISEYARAVVRAWPHVGTGIPAERSVAVLYAQYMTETGGRACWNWNIGNVKHRPGDGFDYCIVQNVWEGVTRDHAEMLLREGKATLDTNPDHIRAVGAGKVAVVLSADNPGCWFRAYVNLEVAMRSHLELLAKQRYASAWPHVIAGDPTAFARELHEKGYFTASAEAYAAAMWPHFDAFVHATAYEEAVAELEPAPAPLWRATVVAPRGLNLRASPSVSAPRLAHMPAGTIVRVLTELPGAKLEAGSPGHGGWSEVLLGARRGYCASEWLARIDEAPSLKDMVEVEAQGERWLVSPVSFAPVSLGQARDHAASLGCELPTPALADAIWRAADLRIEPADMIRRHDGTAATMSSDAIHADVRATLLRLLGGKVAGASFTLMAGAFKDVVEVDGRVGVYGWHTKDRRTLEALGIEAYDPVTEGEGFVVQRPFFGHDMDWIDYSQSVRLVRRI